MNERDYNQLSGGEMQENADEKHLSQTGVILDNSVLSLWNDY